MEAGPPKIKICGVTNLDDAELAVELGAWAVGLIFHRPSPRRCAPAEAERIGAALRRRVAVVGVFVNSKLDEVARMQERVGLTMLQLHGDEGPSFCAEAARRTGAMIVKAQRVAALADLQDLERFHVDYHLADGHGRGASAGLRGGTGESFDWPLVATRRSRVPLIVSGGLHAGNVAEAIAITRPFAVDTASGTEAEPGRKDPERMRAFFDAVRATAAGETAAPAASPAA